MEIFSGNEELEEILISDLLKNSKDHSSIIIKGEKVGKRNEGESDLNKKIIALDTMEIGASLASRIHNVPQSSASKYSDGKDISDDETRIAVLSTRHNIEDRAIGRLMETLNLFDPSGIEKQIDIVKSAGILAGIVERISSKDSKKGNQVVLNLYAPKQNSIEKYEVIDV